MRQRRSQTCRNQTFQDILNNVASKNAVRLMGKALNANQLAHSLRGPSRMRSYAVKSQALLELTTRFPERVRLIVDYNAPGFVLVRVAQSSFGLHAPESLFGRASKLA